MKKLYLFLLLFGLAGCGQQAPAASLNLNTPLQQSELPTATPPTKEPTVEAGSLSSRNDDPTSIYPLYPVRPIYPQHKDDVKQEKQTGGMVRITTFTTDAEPQEIFTWYREQLTQAHWSEDTYQIPSDRISFYYIANGPDSPAFDLTIVIERIGNSSHVLIEHAISGFSPDFWPED